METFFEIIPYICVFIVGICVGSFLNVLIFRIPKGENFVKGRSHCMSCGHELAWYDMFPVFSFIFLRGKCRYCGAKLSMQYPIVEAVNGALWCVSFYRYGWSLMGILVAALLSALLTLAVIDGETMEIPFGINVFIFVIAVIKVVAEIMTGRVGNEAVNDFIYRCADDELSPFGNFVFYTVDNTELHFRSEVDTLVSGSTFSIPRILVDHILGFAIVSGILLLILLITKGRGIGGGDVKLMAAAGLFLGWKLIIISLLLGCVIGTVVHLIRMKFFGAGRKLAMGPYLAIAIGVLALFGNDIIRAYVASVIG